MDRCKETSNIVIITSGMNIVIHLLLTSLPISTTFYYAHYSHPNSLIKHSLKMHINVNEHTARRCAYDVLWS